MRKQTCIALPLLALVFTASQASEECPIVDGVADFDIDEYAAKPWYSHQQAENSYSPLEDNFCVRAQYTVRESSTFFGYTVNVANEAQNSIGAEREGNLCAYQTDAAKSKLAVAPCFLPKFFAGPYWVVVYNEEEGYALISGGQPTIPSYDGDDFIGCKTGTGINNSGLWIFSRSQTRNETLISTVRDIAVEKGFDVTVLNDVDQAAAVKIPAKIVKALLEYGGVLKKTVIGLKEGVSSTGNAPFTGKIALRLVTNVMNRSDQ
eukprot:CAMPEP_0194212590 /NCGR_PEP_ID=MMETSP0156-20130528/12646_1 /TAXON_ID=33649 /ORGANISM="Thalassionema nitzschioides, Strain L26-B" /LENGTH=262 /DNA_ID=CAMNT_0038940457 /DNA_START=54 /DNA_END=840 /DNA_ORIENTATION=+